MHTPAVSRLIENDLLLTDAIAAVAGAEWLALDTEFVRERTYYPQPCILQIAGPSMSFYIELLKRVDTALYEARFQGGNRVVAFQPLSKLKVERWDLQRDGPVNDQSLLQKLLVWGYDTTKLLMRPGTVAQPEIVTDEKVLAISSGELKIEVEGHTMSVKPGDCVFIPQGVEVGLEVVGERQVIKYTASKNK